MASFFILLFILSGLKLLQRIFLLLFQYHPWTLQLAALEFKSWLVGKSCFKVDACPNSNQSCAANFWLTWHDGWRQSDVSLIGRHRTPSLAGLFPNSEAVHHLAETKCIKSFQGTLWARCGRPAKDYQFKSIMSMSPLQYVLTKRIPAHMQSLSYSHILSLILFYPNILKLYTHTRALTHSLPLSLRMADQALISALIHRKVLSHFHLNWR